MKGGICFHWHLGLGDAIICNAIVRHYAEQYPLVVLPVKYHNVPSVVFMFRDMENVVIRPVEDDEDQVFFVQKIWKWERLGLGGYGPGMDWQNWDESFYKQAGIPFEQRWERWKCERDTTKEKKPEDIGPCAFNKYAFVHEDPSRGFKMSGSIGNRTHPLPIVIPLKSETIFDWWSVIEGASEVHAICSSFSLFIDSMPDIKEQKLFLHSYARPGEPLPRYKRDWVILK